jgi:hypothetical protein
MRQYAIFYKRGVGGEFGRLTPNENPKLIDHEEVRDAIEVMRQKPFIERACVRLVDELFDIVSFNQEALAPQAFVFDPPEG